jgi:hypothetical protein
MNSDSAKLAEKIAKKEAERKAKEDAEAALAAYSVLLSLLF